MSGSASFAVSYQTNKYLYDPGSVGYVYYYVMGGNGPRILNSYFNNGISSSPNHSFDIVYKSLAPSSSSLTITKNINTDIYIYISIFFTSTFSGIQITSIDGHTVSPDFTVYTIPTSRPSNISVVFINNNTLYVSWTNTDLAAVNILYKISNSSNVSIASNTIANNNSSSQNVTITLATGTFSNNNSYTISINYTNPNPNYATNTTLTGSAPGTLNAAYYEPQPSSITITSTGFTINWTNSWAAAPTNISGIEYQIQSSSTLTGIYTNLSGGSGSSTSLEVSPTVNSASNATVPSTTAAYYKFTINYYTNISSTKYSGTVVTLASGVLYNPIPTQTPTALVLTPNPNPTNTFTIKWTNAATNSGITGIQYKIRNSSSQSGTYTDVSGLSITSFGAVSVEQTATNSTVPENGYWYDLSMSYYSAAGNGPVANLTPKILYALPTAAPSVTNFTRTGFTINWTNPAYLPTDLTGIRYSFTTSGIPTTPILQSITPFNLATNTVTTITLTNAALYILALNYYAGSINGPSINSLQFTYYLTPPVFPAFTVNTYIFTSGLATGNGVAISFKISWTDAAGYYYSGVLYAINNAAGSTATIITFNPARTATAVTTVTPESFTLSGLSLASRHTITLNYVNNTQSGGTSQLTIITIIPINVFFDTFTYTGVTLNWTNPIALDAAITTINYSLVSTSGTITDSQSISDRTSGSKTLPITKTFVNNTSYTLNICYSYNTSYNTINGQFGSSAAILYLPPVVNIPTLPPSCLNFGGTTIKINLTNPYANTNFINNFVYWYIIDNTDATLFNNGSAALSVTEITTTLAPAVNHNYTVYLWYQNDTQNTPASISVANIALLIKAEQNLTNIVRITIAPSNVSITSFAVNTVNISWINAAGTYDTMLWTINSSTSIAGTNPTFYSNGSFPYASGSPTVALPLILTNDQYYNIILRYSLNGVQSSNSSDGSPYVLYLPAPTMPSNPTLLSIDDNLIIIQFTPNPIDIITSIQVTLYQVESTPVYTPYAQTINNPLSPLSVIIPLTNTLQLNKQYYVKIQYYNKTNGSTVSGNSNSLTLVDGSQLLVKNIYTISTAFAQKLFLPIPNTISNNYFTIIKDKVGNASTYNIIISASGGKTINGNTSITINNNYGSYYFFYNGTTWLATKIF